MANTAVQVGARIQASNAASITASLTGVTAGNLLVAFVSEVSNSTGSITLSAGSIAAGWTSAATQVGTQGTTSKAALAVWYIENAPAGTASITFNGPTGWWNGQIVEYSGPVTSGSLRAGATIQQTPSPVNTGASSATISASAGDLVIAIIDTPSLTSSSQLVTPATPGYTDATNYKGSSGSSSWDHSYKTSAGGSETASWTYVGGIGTVNSTTAMIAFAGSGGGGAGAALAGAATDTTSGSGTLSTGIPLAGSASDTTTASGQLATPAALAGDATDAISATGNLSTGIPLAGGATDTSAASGALTTGIQLAGDATDTTSATGGFPTGGAVLSGGATDATAATGDLSTGIPLAGDASDTTAAVAQLAAGIQLSGDASDGTSSSGALTTSVQLAGDAVDQTSASGRLPSNLLGIDQRYIVAYQPRNYRVIQ